MSVSYGSAVSSANVNAAFVSKTTDSTVAAVVDLNATSSGDRITNAQLEINNLKFSMTATASFAGGASVTASTTERAQYKRVQGSGGAVTLSTTPFGGSGGWIDGTVVRLVGASDTNTVTLANNDSDYGAILNGGCTLKKYDILTLQWDGSFNRWIEVGRNF